MSEVKIYEMFECAGDRYVPARKVVDLQDFDRVTAERDAALGREAALREDLSTANGCLNEWRRSTLGRTLLENTALQQRLTAADELERDAARYRWLMSGNVLNGTLGTLDGWISFEFKDEAQEQIDAEIKRAKGGGNEG